MRFVLALIGTTLLAQSLDTRMYSGLRWRMIGPHRGGRTVGAEGIPSKPNVFFIGVNNGGVWKTTDYGRTWNPIFDDQPTGSVGDLAVSPSNPDLIYVATGEGLQRPDLSVGDGVYKTTDGGKTWRNTGLREGQQISRIIVDPRDPNRVFAAVLGHPYGANQERGLFRTMDGGATWKKVLYKNEHTGAVDVAFDPANPRFVYAVLWEARQAPWENGAFEGPGSGLFKSTDNGETWQPLTNGLPGAADRLGRIGIGIAPSDPNRIYALVDAPRLGGLYRSDNAGGSWTRVATDGRLWGRGSDFACVRVHPKNPDVVFVANIAAYKSEDGGKSWTAIRGAPGGDDYHTIWINPQNPDIWIYATDQGAIITVNGGETYSSWYNQPTAQFYHVITDNQFPYRVYGGQQESGSVGIVSRGDHGQITFREWRPVGVEEYGYVAPDPLDPNIIYGGKATRFDMRTGEVQNIAPEAVRRGRYRFLRTAPILFSPVDPKTLYLAGNVLFKTVNGGKKWDIISPDLSRESYDAPSSIQPYSDPDKLRRRGVIYSLAPSYKDVNTIWVGTDDGLIHVTRDGGKTWSNVTPPDLTPWSKISQLDASRFDANTAYAAVNRFRLDDLRPHVYRTRDGGKTWKRIVKGIAENEVVNAVREDPVRKGLLFAGTERSVWFSPDDGENWHPLRLNMPATSIRDLVIKDNDVVVGTHGRSFWILDDIAPLRELAAKPDVSSPVLFTPSAAYRVRWNKYTDTPLPPEEPGGENPPDGAILYYWLPADSPVTIEVLDKTSKLIRKYSSTDAKDELDANAIQLPTFWIRPHQPPPAKAGMHRFVWDLRHEAPAALRRAYPIAAIVRNTPLEPRGAWVMPGEYTVRLTAGGKTISRTLTVKLDPRVKTPLPALQQQHDLSLKLTDLMRQSREAILRARREGTSDTALVRINGELSQLFNVLQGADAEPTSQAVAAVGELERALREAMGRVQ